MAVGTFSVGLNNLVAESMFVDNHAQAQSLKHEVTPVSVDERGVANHKVWGVVICYFVDLRLALSI